MSGGSKKLLDAALTGMLAYALMLGWAACSGGGGGGGFAIPGMDGAAGSASGGLPGMGSAQAAQSGGRLKAKRRVGSDGSKEFVRWFDAEHGRDCAFAETTEGTLRCLPAGSDVDWESSDYFLDAACSVRAIERSTKCPPPKYALLYASGSSCGGANIVSSVHEVVTSGATSTYFYKSSTGECHPESSTNYVAYPLAEPIAWSSFVEAAVQIDP